MNKDNKKNIDKILQLKKNFKLDFNVKLTKEEIEYYTAILLIELDKAKRNNTLIKKEKPLSAKSNNNLPLYKNKFPFPKKIDKKL